MATTTNKQKVFNQLLSAFAKSQKAGDHEPRPVLEQFIYAILREGSTRSAADRAFQNLQQRFFDWNELRVSGTDEIAEAIEGVGGDLEARAQRLIDFLQEVFETTFSFDLESLHKKGLKQSSKQLARYKAATEYCVAWVVQQSLGGHAIPLDTHGLRVLQRLQLIDPTESHESIQTSLEHLVPKSRGSLFVDGLSEIADVACYESAPSCAACVMRNGCSFSLETKPTPVASAKKPR